MAEAFAARRAHDPAGRVVVLERGGVPWKEHLFDLEEEDAGAETGRKVAKEGSVAKVLYVVYPEKPSPASKWRVQCMPESLDSFLTRKALPEAWQGRRDEELDKRSGIPGCVFVHASGFIGGNQTFEGVMAMTKKALDA